MNPASSSYDMGDYAYNPQIEIRNPRFVDDNHDNILRSNELSKVIFEVMNTSSHMLYDLQPTVVEASGNKRIYISPSVHVESLAPGAAIRYTAMVKAGLLPLRAPGRTSHVRCDGILHHHKEVTLNIECM